MRAADVEVVFMDGDGRPDFKGVVHEATVVGSFVVHRSVAGDRDAKDVGRQRTGFTVTHPPTGYAVAQLIPKAEDAVELARFMEKLPIDWSLSDPKEIVARTGPLLVADIRAFVSRIGGVTRP